MTKKPPTPKSHTKSPHTSTSTPPTPLATLSRPILQSLAKRHKIAANTASSVILQRLCDIGVTRIPDDFDVDSANGTAKEKSKLKATRKSVENTDLEAKRLTEDKTRVKGAPASKKSTSKKRKRQEVELSPRGTSEASTHDAAASSKASKPASRKRQKVRDRETLSAEGYVDTEMMHLDTDSSSQKRTSDIRTMSRGELQSVARQHGIRANTKNKMMIEGLYGKLATYIVGRDVEEGKSGGNVVTNGETTGNVTKSKERPASAKGKKANTAKERPSSAKYKQVNPTKEAASEGAKGRPASTKAKSGTSELTTTDTASVDTSKARPASTKGKKSKVVKESTTKERPVSANKKRPSSAKDKKSAPTQESAAPAAGKAGTKADDNSATKSPPAPAKSKKAKSEASPTSAKGKKGKADQDSTSAPSKTTTSTTTPTTPHPAPSDLLQKLPSLTLKELRAHCKHYGLKQKEKKAVLVESLSKQLQQSLESAPTEPLKSSTQKNGKMKATKSDNEDPMEIDTPTNASTSTQQKSSKKSTTKSTNEEDPMEIDTPRKSAPKRPSSTSPPTQLTVHMIDAMNRSELEYHCTANRIKIPKSKDTMRKKLVEKHGLDMLEFLSLRKESLPSKSDIDGASRKKLQQWSKKFNLKANASTESMREQLTEHVAKQKNHLRKEEIRQSPEKAQVDDAVVEGKVKPMELDVNDKSSTKLMKDAKKAKEEPKGKALVKEAAKVDKKSKATAKETKKDSTTASKEAKSKKDSTTVNEKSTKSKAATRSKAPPVVHEDVPVPQSVKFTANSRKASAAAEKPTRKSPRASARNKFTPPRSAIDANAPAPAAEEPAKVKPAAKKKTATTKKATKKAPAKNTTEETTVGKKRKASSSKTTEGPKKKKRKVSKDDDDEYEPEVKSKGKSQKATTTKPATNLKTTTTKPSTPRSSKSQKSTSPSTPDKPTLSPQTHAIFSTPPHVHSAPATITSPPSLRKRTLPSPGKVQFTETEPQEFTYPIATSTESDSDDCCLCRESAPFGSASSIVCDSCQRRYHRSCVTLRHGTNLDARDRRVPFVCLMCLTGSTRASKRFSHDREPKIHRRLLRALMDIAVVPVRPRRKQPGLMDEGMDISFWDYLEPVERRLEHFHNVQEFKEALFEAYNEAIEENYPKSRIGKEAERLKLWFEEIFDVLGVPMEESLVDGDDGDDGV